MPVTTRQQLSTQRFKQTVEDPCVLQTILHHLDDTDDMKSLFRVSKDARFQDVISTYTIPIINKQRRIELIINTIATRLQNFEIAITRHSKKVLAVDLFSYISENQWFLEEFPQFKHVVLKKLFDLLIEPEFSTHSLVFLDNIFNIRPSQVYDTRRQRFIHGVKDTYGNAIVV